MELHQLRYFLAVARTGSFSRAAAACGIAQPSLSQQVAKLERGLRTPLFDRLPRGAVLTAAGRRLVAYAERALAAVDDAQRDLSAAQGNVSGELALGAIPTIAPYLLPDVLSGFLRRHPDVAVSVVEDVTEELIGRLTSGELDLAVVALPVAHEHIHAEPLAEEPLLLALPAGHALARRKRITWADLADERLLVLHEEHCLGAQVAQVCRRHRTTADVALRGAQLETILRSVAAGLGLAFVPALAVHRETSRRRVYRPLTPDTPHRTLAVAWHLHRFRTNAARAMVAALQKALCGG